VKAQRRRVAAIGALVVAGVAAVATTPAIPSVSGEARDQVLFAGGERSQPRSVSIEVVSGDAPSDVMFLIRIETDPVDDAAPVTLAIVRDRDGVELLREEDEAASYDGDAYHIDLPSATECAANDVCSESFTLTFHRSVDDAQENLRFDWTIAAIATFGALEPEATPPAGASVEVRIGD
jgi:hypothetical protein